MSSNPSPRRTPDERDLAAAINEAMRRMRSVWPGHKWADGEPEYRRVLRRLTTPNAVDQVVDAFIDGAETRFPPPPGVIARLIAERPSAQRRHEVGEVRFEQAAPDHRDPPGTIRWVAIQPDGTRNPRGARLAGEA